jgi:hypothetical protein
MRQFRLSQTDVAALDAILPPAAESPVAFAFAYLRFPLARALYYLPRSDAERAEFLALCERAGVAPRECPEIAPETPLTP